jgi:hypothetical protein
MSLNLQEIAWLHISQHSVMLYSVASWPGRKSLGTAGIVQSSNFQTVFDTVCNFRHPERKKKGKIKVYISDVIN